MSGVPAVHWQLPETQDALAGQLDMGVHVVPSGTSLPTQLPLPSQAAFCWQSLAKVQLLPFADSVCVQLPSVALQLTSWQSSIGVHLGVPMQVPFVHVPLMMHRSLGQAVPFFVSVVLQLPC